MFQPIKGDINYSKLTIYIDDDVGKLLHKLAIDNNKTRAELASEMISYCIKQKGGKQ